MNIGKIIVKATIKDGVIGIGDIQKPHNMYNLCDYFVLYLECFCNNHMVLYAHIFFFSFFYSLLNKKDLVLSIVNYYDTNWLILD